jgi:polar amino acid transport system substrate-binding protein
MKKLLKFIPLLVAALVLTACSSSDENSATSESTTCAPDSLATVEAGVLTIATGEPAYEPWVLNDAPESGEGFEAAVAYAVAAQLGYDQSQVKWIRTTFDGAIAPGPKDFDFNIQQYSITEDRKKVVDFSSAYYQSNQSIVSFKGSKIEGVTSIADLQAKNPKLGAAVASTSLDAIENQLGLKPQVFNDNAAAVEVPNGIIVGQLENSASADEGAGLLLAKDSPITSCVTQAVDAIRDNGTLAAITEQWLAASAGAPFLK